MSKPISRRASKATDTLPSSTPLELKLAAAERGLSARRKQLMRDILNNSEETCFLSSRELAKRFGVDAATIVRTVQALGYHGFADFSDDLRLHFMARITPYTVLKAAAKEKRSVSDHVEHALDKSLDNLNRLRAELDRKQLMELAKLINRSGRVLVVGVDLAATLARYLSYGLVVLGIDSNAPEGSTGMLQHSVSGLNKKDLVIAISFGHCLMETVDALHQANKRGVPTFGITDSHTSPVARYATAHLIAPVTAPSFINSYVAPMAALNAIHVACAHIKPGRSLAMLRASHKEYNSGRRWYKEPKAPAEG
jgi:RpiR family carbohydrate utilization transcriptional regulator